MTVLQCLHAYQTLFNSYLTDHQNNLLEILECEINSGCDSRMIIARWTPNHKSWVRVPPKGYTWRIEACKRVYTPQGVEQVMDVTGLPGIIMREAL